MNYVHYPSSFLLVISPLIIFCQVMMLLIGTIGITYVLDEERTRIIGYFNISVSRIDEIRLQNGEATYHPLGGAAKLII